MTLGVLVAVAFIWVYNALYYDSRSETLGRLQGPASAQESIRNQFDPHLQQRGLIMGRVASFYDWGARNLDSDEAAYALLGHGAGALQFGRIGVGEVAQQLSYRADNTATGLLLWESGIAGHLLIVILFVLGARLAAKLAREADVPSAHQAILHAVSVGFWLHLICLPYKDFMFRAAPSQVILFFMIGYVAYWERSIVAKRVFKSRSRASGLKTAR
jgi:hypothetical protein